MSCLINNCPHNAFTSDPDQSINKNPNISLSALNTPLSQHDSNNYILEPHNLLKQNKEFMNNGRQQHISLHHPQNTGMQNAHPPRDESIMQQIDMGRFDQKFQHLEQRAMKNGNGVSGSSHKYAWEQQPSAYLRHSYDLELDSNTKDYGGGVQYQCHHKINHLH